MSRILLIDSTNNYVRGYVVVPTLNMHGTPIGGVESFLRSLKFFIEKIKPDKVFCVWDGSGGSKKRRAIVPSYKEGRKPYRLNRNYDFETIDVEDNKLFQRVRLDQYLKDLPVYQIMIDDIEADDVIAYLCNHYPDDQKVVVSTDKDYYQVLNPNTIIYNPIKRKLITAKDCKEIIGVYPENFVVLRSIIGDKSDNVKGVKGVGIKNALNYFPFLKEKNAVGLDDIFKFCEENGKKYQKFLDAKEVIINNHKIMQLKNTIISFSNITKIKDIIDTKPVFSPMSFKLKLIEDGLHTIDDAFLPPFRILSL